MEVFQAQGKKKSGFKLIELSPHLLHMFHFFGAANKPTDQLLEISYFSIQHPTSFSLGWVFQALFSPPRTHQSKANGAHRATGASKQG